MSQNIFTTEQDFSMKRSAIKISIRSAINLSSKKINIRADWSVASQTAGRHYRFKDKAKYYLGLVQGKQPTKIHELHEIAENMQDFTACDIQNRTEKIVNSFITFLTNYKLTK